MSAKSRIAFESIPEGGQKGALPLLLREPLISSEFPLFTKK